MLLFVNFGITLTLTFVNLTSGLEVVLFEDFSLSFGFSLNVIEVAENLKFINSIVS